MSPRNQEHSPLSSPDSHGHWLIGGQLPVGGTAWGQRLSRISQNSSWGPGSISLPIIGCLQCEFSWLLHRTMGKIMKQAVLSSFCPPHLFLFFSTTSLFLQGMVLVNLLLLGIQSEPLKYLLLLENGLLLEKDLIIIDLIFHVFKYVVFLFPKTI